MKKVLEAFSNKNVSLTDIVDSQARIIVDNLTLQRKVEEFVKPNKTTVQVKVLKPKALWVGTSISDQHLQANKLKEKVDAKVDKLKAFTITQR